MSAREVWEREMFFAELARAAADDEPRQTDIPNKPKPCAYCGTDTYGRLCRSCTTENQI